MKLRLLVMNGQKILQVESAGQWVNEDVKKAGNLLPGVYELFRAKPAELTEYSGKILYSDDELIYQKADNFIVKFQRADFETIPEIGSLVVMKRQNKYWVFEPID